MHQGGSGNVPIPKQERNAFQPRGQIAQPSSTASVIEAVDQVQAVGIDKDSYRVKLVWGTVNKVGRVFPAQIFAMLTNT